MLRDDSTAQKILYASPYDSDFFPKVYHDARFYHRWLTSDDDFKLTEQQIQLGVYFSPIAPVSSMALVHNTGTGKSNTVIQAALSMSSIPGSKPAYFLVPNNSIRSGFIDELLGRTWRDDEDGHSRAVFSRRITGDLFIDEDFRTFLNGLPEHQKERHCKVILDQYVSQYFELETQTRFLYLILGHEGRNLRPLSDEEVARRFSNRVIVVDEAHNNRNEGLFFKALDRVIRLAKNVRLILLTATPMVESADEICPLLNLLLLNDGFPESSFITPKVVAAFLDSSHEKHQEARAMFRNAMKGRISYVRGMDPRYFPIRVDEGVRIFDGLPDHRVVLCPLTGMQLEHYLRAMQREAFPNAEAGQTCNIWQTSRLCARVVMPPSLNLGRWSEAAGKNVWFGNITSKHWRYNVIDRISSKQRKIHDIVMNHNGPALLFSMHVEMGLKVNRTYFRANGAHLWSKKYPRATGKDQLLLFNIGGNTTSHHIRASLQALKSDAIRHERAIVTASPANARGVTLRHTQAVVLEEMEWDIPNREQIVGRAMRHHSHTLADGSPCNKVVHVYQLCATIEDGALDTISDQRFVRRYRNWLSNNREKLAEMGFIDDKTGRLLTIDERTLKNALLKDIGPAKILRFMKEHSLPLNLAMNYFPEEGDRYAGTRIHDYEQQPARVPIPNERFPSPPSAVPPIPKETYSHFVGVNSLFEFFVGHSVDLKGDLKRGFERLFSVRQCWPLATFLKQLSDLAGCSRQRSLLFLHESGAVRKTWALVNGWIIRRGQSSSDPVRRWQESPGVAGLTGLTPFGSLETLMKDAINVDLKFGVLATIEPTYSIPTQITREVISIQQRSDAVIAMKRGEAFCGIVGNTPDHPDSYQLKIMVYDEHQSLMTEAAKTRYRVPDLMRLVEQISGDVAMVRKSKSKINTSCRILEARLIESKRLFPWPADKTPSLYRLRCCAVKWNLDEVIATIDGIVQRLLQLEESLTVAPFVWLFVSLENRTSEACLEKAQSQIADRVNRIPNYVLRVLDRFHDVKPRSITEEQFKSIYTPWFHQWITTREATTLSKVHEAMMRHLENEVIV